MSNQLMFETKFGFGDKVYLIEEKPVTIECGQCNSKGNIESQLLSMNITCPVCKGAGSIELRDILKWRVVEDPFTISEIKIKARSRNRNIIRYTAYNKMRGSKHFSEQNLYSSKEIAQSECYRRNRPSKRIDLVDIKIKNCFAHSLPNPEKMNACYEYYRNHHRLDRDIEINEDDVLVDGYVAYLVYKMLGIESVRAVISEEVY